MLMLVPAQLGLTIPMALLIAILVAFGRFSADREIVVMMACGVSPLRLLRPVLLLSTLAAAATAWVMIEAIPDANQTFREITLRVVADRAEGQVRPREFFADFPDTVLYVREVPPDGGWKDVFAADTRNPMQPVIYLARTGRMIVNREKHTIEMVLEDGVRHTTNANDPAVYRMARFVQLIVSLDPESVFPRAGPARGEREMTIAELEARIADLKAQNLPYHNPVMEIQKKFSLPAACLVFALVGVGLGISNRKDGKLASFVLGIAVIFIYYVAMFMAQSLTKGALIPSWLAMWVPNILLGAAGLALVALRSHGIDQAQFRLPSFSWLQSRAHRSADTAATSSSPAPAPRRRGGTVIVIRVPQFQLPRPESARPLHRPNLRPDAGDVRGRSDGRLLHHDVHRPVRQALQGAGLAGDDPVVSLVGDAAVPVLHHCDRSAAGGHRHDRRADQEQRVDRDAGVRDQHLPHRAAAARLRGTREHGALHFRGAHPRGDQPARRIPAPRHPRRQPADLRRAQPQMAHRIERRDLPLPVLRPDAARAQFAVGASVRSGDARR